MSNKNLIRHIFDKINKFLNSLIYGDQNSYRFQRRWAKRYLNSNLDNYSNLWGSIEKYNPGLGDYKKISKDIIKYSCPNSKEVIDIGCLDGKWSVELAKHFHKVHCVDLTDLLYDLLREKLNDKMGVFYKTKGYELDGF